MKRKVDLVIISDVHLGTYGCKAKELLAYLKSIKAKKIILNGDFIDIWQFKKSYFPATHLEIIKHILNLSLKGTEVIYITGNHDEFLRKFPKVQFGNIQIVDKLVLTVDYKKVWIFHGDVFDLSVQHSKWIAKLGGIGYDYLIRINNLSNWVLKQFGYEKYSFSKKIKNSVKKAVKYINDFEQTAAELAIENNYDYVICGHIHQPQIKKVTTNKGECVYLNSGDWIENLTTIEFHKGLWKIHHYETGLFEYENQEDWLKNELLEQDEQMFENLMESIQIKIK